MCIRLCTAGAAVWAALIGSLGSTLSGLICLALIVLVACRFTRLSGELFGFLIAVLFMQQAIKGTRLEFLPQQGPDAAR